MRIAECRINFARADAAAALRVTLSPMPGKRSFEEQIAALDSLRQQPPEDCIEPLQAEPAIEAILRAMLSEEVTTRLEKLVAENPRLARAFVALRK